MTDAQTILKLIETVDPSDTAKLDEIDAYVHNLFYPSDTVEKNSANGEWYNRHNGWTFYGLKYTRSRDALKAIRPTGYFYSSNSYQGKDGVVRCMAWITGKVTGHSPYLPTEELAELHAIIQAIAHDRSAAPLDTEQGD